MPGGESHQCLTTRPVSHLGCTLQSSCLPHPTAERQPSSQRSSGRLRRDEVLGQAAAADQWDLRIRGSRLSDSRRDQREGWVWQQMSAISPTLLIPTPTLSPTSIIHSQHQRSPVIPFFIHQPGSTGASCFPQIHGQKDSVNVKD